MQTHYRVPTPKKKFRATGNHSPQHADKGPGSPSSKVKKLGDIIPPGSPVPVCREYFPASLENMLQKTLLYKTTFCSAWLGNEKCEFGAGCLFAHGEEELETTQGNIERVRKSMELILASKEEKARAEGKLLTTPSRNAPACPPLLPCQIASPQSIASLYDQGNYLLYNGHDNRRSWSPKHPPAIVSGAVYMNYDETEEHFDPDEHLQIASRPTCTTPATWTEYQAIQQHEDETPAEENEANITPLTHPKVVRVTANTTKTGFMDLLEKCEDAEALVEETPNPPSYVPKAPSPSPKDDPTKLFAPISHSIDLDTEVNRYLQWENLSKSKTNASKEQEPITDEIPRAPAWCSGRGTLKHWKTMKKSPCAKDLTNVPLESNNAKHEPLWCNGLFDDFYHEHISWIWCDTFPVIDRDGKEDPRVDFDLLSPYSTTIWTFTTAEQLETELLLPPSSLSTTNEVGKRALAQTEEEEHDTSTSYLDAAKKDPKKIACPGSSPRQWCYTFLGNDDFQPTRYDLILDWLGKVSIPDICVHQF